MDKIIRNSTKSEEEIFETTNIQGFKVNSNNRQINKNNIKNIKASIIKIGGIIQPIIINKNGEIIDGHHRFYALKELISEGCDYKIKYIISHNNNDSVGQLIECNTVSQKWTIVEFMNLRAKQNPYGNCANFINKYKDIQKESDRIIKMEEVLSIGLKGIDIKRNTQKARNDEDLNINWDKLSLFYKEIINKLMLNPKKIKLSSVTKQILFTLYELGCIDSNIFIEEVQKKYNQTNEQINLSSKRGICKEQIIELYNGKRKTKNIIEYVKDSKGKIIIKNL